MSTTVDLVTDAMAAATIADPTSGADNAAQNDAVIAIVAEGRRLYIGNLAYATTEGDLNDFFKGYLV
jgi:RNA recognition motif-containing protein